jgi:hypothetical protein
MPTAAQLRQLIANKSPITAKVDPRPRCQDCGSVLTERDFKSYWDGPDPSGVLTPGASPEVARAESVPRCCENCAEEAELKSV